LRTPGNGSHKTSDSESRQIIWKELSCFSFFLLCGGGGGDGGGGGGGGGGDGRDPAAGGGGSDGVGVFSPAAVPTECPWFRAAANPLEQSAQSFGNELPLGSGKHQRDFVISCREARYK